MKHVQCGYCVFNGDMGLPITIKFSLSERTFNNGVLGDFPSRGSWYVSGLFFVMRQDHGIMSVLQMFLYGSLLFAYFNIYLRFYRIVQWGRSFLLFMWIVISVFAVYYFVRYSVISESELAIFSIMALLGCPISFFRFNN